MFTDNEDKQLTLATIPLLGKPSDQALMDIVSYHNNRKIDLRKVDIGVPSSYSGGRRTRVVISAKPSTPYRDNNYIQSMNFVYNRLNLTEVFLPYVLQGVELETPVTTEKILAHLKTFLPFIHDEDEFIPRVIYNTSESFFLEANPNSLRWHGSINIPLTLVTDINDLINQDFLDGLEDVNLISDLEDLIKNIILKGLNYSEFLPSLETIISKAVLKGLDNNNFVNYLSTIFPKKTLPGHWRFDSNGEVEIVSDISLPSLTALRTLIEDSAVIKDVDYDIVSISDLYSNWPSAGKVELEGNEDSGFIGPDTLYFERINIEDLVPGGAVSIETIIETDPEESLDEINALLGTDLELDQIDFIPIDVSDGAWILKIKSNDAMFYGELNVNDAAAGVLMLIEGLVPIVGTEYYKFKEDVSFTEGPEVWATPPSVESLGVYKARWVTAGGGNPSEIRIEKKNTIGLYERVAGMSLATAPNHISLTFDSNGSYIISYELEGMSYIYFYDPLESSFVTTDLGPVKSPFVSQSSYNEVISLTRQVYCVYVKSDNSLCYRAQDDRYTIEYVIETDVIDIMAIGRTSFNSLKIEYLKENGTEDYSFDNIATDADGYWVSENLENVVSGLVERMEIRDITVWMTDEDGIVERPIGIVEREVTDIEVSTFTYERKYIEGIEERPIGIVNREVTDIVVTVRPQLFHYTLEEPEPESGTTYEHTVELVNFELVDVRRDLEQEEPEPLPGSLYDHIVELVSISFNHTLTGLINLIDSVDELVEEDYTIESWDEVIGFRSAAQLVADEPSSNQNEINTAWNNLDTAINTLVPV